MKNILIKGVLLGALLVFLVKGGMRLLLLGWRLFVPLLIIAVGYFTVRHFMQKKKKVGARPEADTLGSGQPISICPHCHKPRGSCPQCQS